jgi:aminoglycoside 6'-N-acetyltransferase I
MSFHVRPIAPGDREEWLRMRHTLWPDCPEERHFLEMQQLAAAEYGGVVLVISRDGGGAHGRSLGGFAEVSVRHDHVEGALAVPTPYLEGWYVDEDLRGRGVGRELLRSVEDWARKHGFAELASDAELDNHASIDAHHACGFTETCRTVHFIKRLKAESK